MTSHWIIRILNTHAAHRLCNYVATNKAYSHLSNERKKKTKKKNFADLSTVSSLYRRVDRHVF